MSKKRDIDSTYWHDFRIKTPIRYLSQVVVDPKIERQFRKNWTRFYTSRKSLLSKTRENSLKSFMSLVEKNSSDAFTRSGVAIEYLDRSIGYGVFAKRNFPPYKALIHYTGILTLDQNIPDLNNSTFAFTEFSQYAIDGAYRGNWARFMNHADLGEKECNVIPWELYLPEGPRIVFTTGKRGVLKGEQLLYSYGDDYWEE